MRLVLLAALGFLSFGIALELRAAERARPIDLTGAGEERALPARMFGESAEPFWENLIDDPEKVAAVKSLHPATTRFPGGTLCNYYDWKRGLFFLEPQPDSSAYYKLFVRYAQWVAEKFPKGISFEQYKAFSDAVGAEVVMDPNLETASVEDQTEWFKHLASEHMVPTHIELGNEYWIATGMDRHVLKRWPDEPTSMRIMRQYTDAFRPYLPKGAKIAVQATGSSYQTLPETYPPLTKRLREWDEALKPEPWFDAVTVHLYPKLTAILGRPDALEDPITPENSLRNLRALMGHVDDGIDNVLCELAARVPGKEIWITEWNPRGGGTATDRNQTQPATPALSLQLVTRMSMAFLRHPEVTIAQFYMISFLTKTPRCLFVREDGAYQPVPAALVLRWFNEAANGGVNYRRYIEAGATRIPGGGVKKESYAAVEAALFRGKDRATLILQNASGDARSYRIGANLKLKTPSLIEQVAMPNLAETALHGVKADTVRPAMEIAVPAYSVTRMVWNLR